MEKYKQRALQKSHIVLIQNLNMEILDYLYGEFVLTRPQMQKIKAEKTDQEKRSLLLDMLVETGRQGSFESFLKALKDTHQEFLAEEITKNLLPLEEPQDVSVQEDNQGANIVVCSGGRADYSRDVEEFSTGRKKDLNELLFQMTEQIKLNQLSTNMLNQRMSQIDDYKSKYEDELKKQLEEKTKDLKDAKAIIDQSKSRESKMVQTLFMQKDKIVKTTEKIKRVKELEVEYKDTHWINIPGRYKVVKMMRKTLQNFESTGDLCINQENPQMNRSQSLTIITDTALNEGDISLQEAPN